MPSSICSREVCARALFSVISSVRDFSEFSQRVVRWTLLVLFSPVLSTEICFFAPRVWRCFISSLQKVQFDL
jgi:hypothetical protein